MPLVAVVVSALHVLPAGLTIVPALTLTAASMMSPFCTPAGTDSTKVAEAAAELLVDERHWTPWQVMAAPRNASVCRTPKAGPAPQATAALQAPDAAAARFTAAAGSG